jgi:hypothetical protein
LVVAQRLFNHDGAFRELSDNRVNERRQTGERQHGGLEDRIERLERGAIDLSARDIALPAASAYVDVEQIANESTRLKSQIWIRCHLLNRLIPCFVEISRVLEQRVTLS